MRQVIFFISGVILSSAFRCRRIAEPELLGLGDILGCFDKLLELADRDFGAAQPIGPGDCDTMCCGPFSLDAPKRRPSGLSLASSPIFRPKAFCSGVLPIKNSPGGISTSLMPTLLFVSTFVPRYLAQALDGPWPAWRRMERLTEVCRGLKNP